MATARILGLPHGTVKPQLTRARAKIALMRPVLAPRARRTQRCTNSSDPLAEVGSGPKVKAVGEDDRFVRTDFRSAEGLVYAVGGSIAPGSSNVTCSPSGLAIHEQCLVQIWQTGSDRTAGAATAHD
jgi:hypothetical protein